MLAFCHKGGVICISVVIVISPGNLDSRLCFIQPGISHDVDIEQQTASKLEKEYVKAVYCHSAFMWNARLDEAQAGLKIARRNTDNFKYADTTTLMAESEEELKSLLMKMKESEKADLKLNIQKTKIMASCPIISWQIDEETM